MSARVKWRRFVSNFMLTLTGLCALGLCERAISYSGVFGFQWRHVHQLGLLYATSKPVGEPAEEWRTPSWEARNCCWQPRCSACRSGSSGDLSGGVQRGRRGFGGAYAADLLNGVPSIVIGFSQYSMVVLPFRHFSTFAGAFALGLMMIPITLRSTEEFLNGVPRYLREGAMALGQANGRQ